MSPPIPRKAGGFTLVELLVVIGVIALLIGMLLPSLSGTRERANIVVCMSNMRQIGLYLEMYSNANRGALFPPNGGANRPRTERWPVYVMHDRPEYDHPIMLCPSDIEPAEAHSYILNYHLHVRGVKRSSRDFGGLTISDVVLMGEKRSERRDYYMNPGDFPSRVEFYRHGLRNGSNYLFLDGHVGMLKEIAARSGMDPWDLPMPPPAEDPG